MHVRRFSAVYFLSAFFMKLLTTFHRRKNMYANVFQLRAFLYACTMEMFFVQCNRFVNKKGKYTIHILNFKSVTCIIKESENNY